MSINLILYVVALILLLLAAIGVSVPRVSLGWLGLFFWLLANLL
jgi:hypothetical protein